jgi:hypothetical protein
MLQAQVEREEEINEEVNLTIDQCLHQDTTI